jgi:hypothetical protein
MPKPMMHTVLSARHHIDYFFWKWMIVASRCTTRTFRAVLMTMLMLFGLNMIGSNMVQLGIRCDSAYMVQAGGTHSFSFRFVVML